MTSFTKTYWKLGSLRSLVRNYADYKYVMNYVAIKGFYQGLFFSLVAAYFNDIAVGAVCCRVDHSQNQKRLYIMTLGCLAPYRRLGIGKNVYVLRRCCAQVISFLFSVNLPLPFPFRYEDAEPCPEHL